MEFLATKGAEVCGVFPFDAFRVSLVVVDSQRFHPFEHLSTKGATDRFDIGVPEGMALQVCLFAEPFGTVLTDEFPNAFILLRAVRFPHMAV